jgi:hypothetical protein
MTKEISEYLGRDSAKERKMIVRSRCRNEKKQVLDRRRGMKMQNVL